MQLTYNQFRKVAAKSSEKLFDKFSGIFAESENAALMALFDDKIILLDEITNRPYICEYTYTGGILSFGKFEPINLVDNDNTVLESKVHELFDIENEPPASLDELVEGFRLRFYDNTRREVTAAKDNKARKMHENSDIRVKHELRDLRDKNYALISELLRKPGMKKLIAKMALSEEDAVASSLNQVDWNKKKGYKVDTNIYTYIEPDMKDLEDKSAKRKMSALAGKLYKIWKTDAFRKKFMSFSTDMKEAADFEDAMEKAEMFFEENKELFLLEPTRFQEVILKTALMVNSKDANVLVEIFNKLMRHPDVVAIKESYFDTLKATPEQIAQVMFEQDEIPAIGPEAPDSEGASAAKEEEEEPDEETIQILKDTIATFKKIKETVPADSDVEDTVDGIIDGLENIKAKGITDDKMRGIIDFLQGSTPKEDEKEDEKDEKEEEPSAELE